MSQPGSPAETNPALPEYLMGPIEVIPSEVANDPDYLSNYTVDDPDAAVQHVHAVWPETTIDPVPDAASQVAFEEYAQSRFDPRFAGSVPTVFTRPAPPVTAHRLRRGEGWVADITPRLSAAVLVATTAIANLSGNFASIKADIGEEVANLLHQGRVAAHQLFGVPMSTEEQTVETTTPGQTIVLGNSYPQEVGKSAPSASDITKIVEGIKDEQANGGEVTSITIFAGSSDEWGPNEESLRVPNAGNDELDSRRAGDAAGEFAAQTEGMDLPEVEVMSAENLLTESDVVDIKAEAAKHDLTIEDAIRIYNRGGKLPAQLQALLQSKLGDARSVVIRVEVKRPDQTRTDTITVEKEAPEDKDHDYDLYLGLPLPFFPRLRREEYVRMGVETWVRPGAAPDERWVELYKEVMQEDGSLPRDAWAYTRKYQLLAREDRIDYVLTHRYLDADGEERDMRVMFVDHDPSDETIAMFKELLNNVAQMNGGKVGERWSAITVFPRDQVGTDPTAGRTANDRYPHHPADIGLDIDQQDPSSVMGVSMPALGLIEMHMPVEMIGEDDKIQRPTRADLEDYLGAMYVAAHEAAGHATDTTGEVVYLVPAGPEEFRHYRTTNVWADRAREAFNTTPNVDARGPRELDVTVHAQTDDNRNEEIVPVTEHVSTRSGDDPRLRMSHHAVLLDRKPTRYASDSPGELYGEIAGQVVSGAPIPYSEAALVVNAPHPRLGRGYAVDPNLRQLLIDRTGWDPETARPVNENEFTLTTAEDDPMLGPWIDEARRTPMPDDRITILAGVVGLEN